MRHKHVLFMSLQKYSMKFSFLLFILLLPIVQYGQEEQKNYEIYHKYINEAEIAFFKENNFGEAIDNYKKAFEEFDFVFVKDVVNAIQISEFCNLESEEFLLKGFENGLKLDHLKKIELLKLKVIEWELNADILSSYQTLREKYVNKINYKLLLELYDRSMKDQVSKNLKQTEYDRYKKDDVFWIRKKIREVGFPGQKIVGIGDENIFSNIDKPNFDFNERKKSFNNIDYFSIDEKLLSMKLPIIILIHNQCAYNELVDSFKDLVRKGEIHPREVGLLHDNVSRNINSRSYRCSKKPKLKECFYLNLFANYGQLTPELRVKINSNRSKWQITSIELDELKKKYESDFGFQLFWGFWSSQ